MKKGKPRPTIYKLETKEELHEFLWTVKDDLQFIRELNYSIPSRATVRIAASILRRLLVDQMYHAAWHFVDPSFSPHVQAIDLSAIVARVEPRYIHYAYAGGAPTKGAQHFGHALLVIPKDEVDPSDPEATVRQVSNLLSSGEQRDFSLSDFCSSSSVVVGNVSVSRAAVIRYVANKLGGVHWDNQRGAWADPVGVRHRLLDENHILVGRLSAPLYEVISIANDLARSVDAISLIERISESAPEPELSEDVLRFRQGRSGAYADMTFSRPGKAATTA